MTYHEAINLANHLIANHGLDKTGWKAECNNTRRFIGICDHRRKKILLSINFLYREDHKIKNTILHEIAHAICGYEHQHNLVWKTVAQQIGCNGERCGEL